MKLSIPCGRTRWADGISTVFPCIPSVGIPSVEISRRVIVVLVVCLVNNLDLGIRQTAVAAIKQDFSRGALVASKFLCFSYREKGKSAKNIYVSRWYINKYKKI